MLVEINAKSMRINSGDSGPSLQQSGAADRTGGQRTELGHGPPVAGDCETFPPLHPIDNLAAMVAKVANRNLGHSPSVSRVRRVSGERRSGQCAPQVELRKVRNEGCIPIHGPDHYGAARVHAGRHVQRDRDTDAHVEEPFAFVWKTLMMGVNLLRNFAVSV
jgi:hypothetical protein